MKKSLLALFVLVLLATTIVGCGTSPTPTPAVTPTPLVVTVVITATPPPATATSAAPTITPLPTIAVTTTVPAATPVAAAKPTNTAGAPKATATKKPATPAAAATATNLPVKYSAPRLMEPMYDSPGIDGNIRKDDRHYPGDTLIFKWASVGNLGAGECYAVRVDLESTSSSSTSRGDTFLACDAIYTQVQRDYPVAFQLNRPTDPGPNYAGLLGDSSEYWVRWSVTIVKTLTPSPDKTKTAPISPTSDKVKFLLKG